MKREDVCLGQYVSLQRVFDLPHPEGAIGQVVAMDPETAVVSLIDRKGGWSFKNYESCWGCRYSELDPVLVDLNVSVDQIL